MCNLRLKNIIVTLDDYVLLYGGDSGGGGGGGGGNGNCSCGGDCCDCYLL